MALRSGAAYLAALKDGREVYLDGKRVEDITTEPGLRNVALTTAALYDFVATHQDDTTFADQEGRRLSLNWIEPRDRDELMRRRNFSESIARRTGGLFGRQQDYVPLFHLGMLDIKEDFSRGDPRFLRNIENYWRFAADNDLMLAHAFIDVQAHPATPIDDTVVPRMVAQRDDGIVVQGAKTIGTFAAHADEVLIGGFPRLGLNEKHALYFSIPIATPGVRIIARTAHDSGSAFDHPAHRFGDENDCMIIMDDVLVPWERVFSLGDFNFCATVFPRITEWAHWSILARLAVKVEVLTGLYALIPEMLGRGSQPQTQEALGEIVRYLTSLRAFIHAAEDQGSVSPGGHFMPNPAYVTAGRAYSVENYRRITGYLHDIASQALINVPTEKAFESPSIGPVLEKIFASPTASARDRARVTRLAWDMVCDSFGGRQTLFELFNALPWTAQRAQLMASFDADPYRRLALATAGIGSLEEAATAAADAAALRRRDYEAVGQAYAEKSAGRTSAR